MSDDLALSGQDTTNLVQSRQVELEQKLADIVHKVKEVHRTLNGIQDTISQIRSEVIDHRVISDNNRPAGQSTFSSPVFADDRIQSYSGSRTLEQRVLEYVNVVKTGVQVTDMENEFKETRMRIGFVTKKLLDEGKIRKNESLYFPVNPV